MVFQEEDKLSWFGLLGFRGHAEKDAEKGTLGSLRRPSCSSGSSTCSTNCTSLSESEDETERQDRERGFDIADSVEKGLAREVVTEFMHPLRRSSKLWRFHITRSEDKSQYRLFSDDGDFLMYARVNVDVRRVDFFLYNPTAREDRLYDPSRPAFTMTYSKDHSEWRLVQERCEHCRFAPKHLSCACHGKQQVAFIRHARTPIGDGIFNCMEVNVPGLYKDGGRVLWCPMNGKGDLASPPESCREVQRLVTKEPAWNNQVESLVLDFKGRNVLSSAKNFQLAMSNKPEHVICQFGKVGPSTFSLDFRYPLSVVQAFGVSLSTMHWI